MSSSRRASSRSKGRAPDVLSAAYLERTGSKDELLRRLHAVTDALSGLSDEDPAHALDPKTHPGLLSLSAALVAPAVLAHRDKDVRLAAVLAACELFYLYAPEPPWDAAEIVGIFGQLVRQLGNLRCASPGRGGNFAAYYRILEQLSEVKIGVVLVDLIRTERGHSGAGGGPGGGPGDGEEPALDALCDLLRTLLTCVHVDHPPEVAAHAELAVSACIEEFEGTVPVRVLEEVLTCVGEGPVVWVTNPAFARCQKQQKKRKKKSPGSGGRAEQGGAEGDAAPDAPLPPPQIQQTNPSYLVAAKVLRRTEDKISSPIAALLNGLLTGDPHVVGRTALSTADAEAAALLLSPRGAAAAQRQRRRRKDAADGAGEDAEGSPTALELHLQRAPPGGGGGGGGANVYDVSYELHRIAPQILTTVIGTVSTSLVSQDLAKRWQATKLLGRLFGARTSDIAGRFGPCFREWLRRSYDPAPRVRETMVRCLVNFLATQHAHVDLCADVNEALSAIIVRDPTLEIRLLGIHQVCDLAHQAAVSDSTSSSGGEDAAASPTAVEPAKPNKYPGHPISVISPELLHAVSHRVSSKDKVERKDAITGLSQIYFKHYLRKKLKLVQEGGDDVSIDEILEVWHLTQLNASPQGSREGREDEERFAWIPTRVMECVSFADADDAEMRSRVFQLVDDVLLGACKGKPESGSTLTPTSRAIGLALIVASVKEKGDAYLWMQTLFLQRSRLQRALGSYLDARARAKEHPAGSAEAYATDSEAMEKLEAVASLSPPVQDAASSPSSSSGKSPGPGSLEVILKKIHSAKDKHIFRILSTISLPTHSSAARLRAFDELPKRTRSLGTAAQSWVKTLARRCAMGAFLNADSVEHCTMLAQECFEAEECETASAFLDCVKFGVGVFPSLGSTEKGFKNLVELFDLCRTTTKLGSEMKKEVEKFGIVTTLSEVLARSGTAAKPESSRPGSSGKKKKIQKCKNDEFEMDSEDLKEKSPRDTLRKQLLRLCTKDGTPEQARNSVYTISSMMRPIPVSPLSSNTPCRANEGDGNAAAVEARAHNEKKEFEPLLKALVNPSSLAIPDAAASLKSGGRVVSVLSAIAAVAECAPYAFNARGKGQKAGFGRRAVEFCLDTVLLGKDMLNTSTQQTEDSEKEKEGLSPMNQGKSVKAKKGNDKVVSVHCQMLCGAIEVLVSHIRSTVVTSQRNNAQRSSVPLLEALTPDHLQEVFDTLVQILENGGVPPSSVNGRYCQTLQDRAELRRSAAVNLLRLCDANLRLEATYLTPRMWQVLGAVLLDPDRIAVRVSFTEELASMYASSGRFRAHGAAALAPSLRFVALITLCARDGDRAALRAKSAVEQCVNGLRKACQVARAQCRLEGRESEKKFESQWKRRLMPEYCVPYALHFLAYYREETVITATIAPEEEGVAEGESEVQSQGVRHKMLKKRLKWLFDPLIQSLGAGADNISFLLRMVELIGKHPPINVHKKHLPTTVLKENTVSGEISSLDLSVDDDPHSHSESCMDEKEAAVRMRDICRISRDVLLSYVKKDVNLTVYPGSIQIPGDLYLPRTSITPRKVQTHQSGKSEDRRKKRLKRCKSISHYVKSGKVGRDEILLDEQSDDEKLVEEEKSEGNKSDLRMAEQKNVSGGTFECSLNESEYNKSEENFLKIQKERSSPRSNTCGPEQLSPTISLLASPPSGNKGFDQGFDDVSPISKADSPVGNKSRGRKNPQAKLSAKKVKSSKKKRKSSEIAIFDEFTSPAATDVAGSSAFSEKTPLLASEKPPKKLKPSKSSSSKKQKAAQSSTPRAVKSSGSKTKPKASPVSVPVKTVMVNITNSAGSANSDLSGMAMKKRYTKVPKKVTKEDELDFEKREDDLDFSESLPKMIRKPKVKSKPVKKDLGKKSVSSQKNASGSQARIKVSTSASSGKKAAPARKLQVPKAQALAKENVGKKILRKAASARKARSPVKAKVPAKIVANKNLERATRKRAKSPSVDLAVKPSRRKKATPKTASPSATSVASCTSLVRHGTRRRARSSTA